MQPISPTTFMPMPAQGFTKPDAAAQEAGLKKAVEDFSSVLFAQMFQEMRESGQDEEGEGIFGGGDTNMFMHLMDQEVGKSFAAAGGNGLKEALYRQLSGRMANQVEPKGAGQ